MASRSIEEETIPGEEGPQAVTGARWNVVLEAGPSPRKRRQSTGHTIADRQNIIDEDGRTYQGYDPGEYWLPNDGDEQNRQDLQHHIYSMFLDGRLAAAPIDAPRYVLDIGTGTGIWALQFAQQNRTSHVIGTDLSAIQPETDRPNVEFWVENSETAEWIFPNKFDYIHIRSMAPCFSDFMTMVRKSYQNMEPGGWLELADVSLELRCIDASAEGTALERFLQLVIMGAANLGRDMIKSKFYKEYLTAGGFVDVEEEKVPAPLGPWARDEKFRRIGLYMEDALLFSLESYWKFVSATGISQPEIEDLKARVKEELMNRKIHGYLDAYFVYGRKPYDWELSSNRPILSS